VLERARHQRIAGEERHVLAEYLVARRLPSPEVIVVNAGQVVVDERHGVDHLDGACDGDGGVIEASDELARSNAEHRAEPLAAREERVAHGFVDVLGLPELNGCVQGSVHCVNLLQHVSFEIEFNFLSSHSVYGSSVKKGTEK